MNYEIFHIQQDAPKTLGATAQIMADEFWLLNEYVNMSIWNLYEKKVTAYTKESIEALILKEILSEKKRAIKKDTYRENISIDETYIDDITSSIVLFTKTEKCKIRYSSSLGGNGSVKRRAIIEINSNNERDILNFHQLKSLVIQYFYNSNYNGYIVITTDVLYQKYFSSNGLVYGWMGIYPNHLIPEKLPSYVSTQDVGDNSKLIITTTEDFDDINPSHVEKVDELARLFREKLDADSSISI